MSYLFSIKTAVFTFPIIAFLFTIPYILYEYHKRGAIHFFRTLIVYTFILYLLIIYFLVILPLPTFEEALKNTGPYTNFIPFNFIRDFIKETSLVITEPHTYFKALTEPCFYVVVFNIFMTVPFGMYLRYYFKCSFKKTVFCTFLLSLFFEITQVTGLYFIYPNPYRLCDIDDLILNTSGGALGYLLFGLFQSLLPTKEKIDEETSLLSLKVSGLRRLTVFFLDLFLYGFFFLISSIFIKTKYLYLYVFIVYYHFIPFIIPNQTLGMRFVNVRMEYKKIGWLFNILRSFFLVFYYFFLPYLVGAGVYNFSDRFTTNTKIYLILGYIVFYFLFYLIHLIVVLIKKRLYYDKIFGFSFESTAVKN